MDASTTSRAAQPARDKPLVVVSCDTHIGPRLVEDLRPYCPAGVLEDFDAFAAQTTEARAAIYARMGERSQERFGHNRQTAGHYDMAARLADMDRDGVAAEVIFHGSQNEEPVPFGTFVVFLDPATSDLDLVAEGRRIYNRWLADAISLEPERHVGLAQLPMWDVDAAIRELTRARESGVTGVNFPAPRAGLPPYNDPVWEPFWSACEDLAMPLATHAGAGDPDAWTGREATALMSLESGGWFSRRALHQMIFGGVFERHPRLQLVLTEQPGDWWSYTLREMDSAFLAHRRSLGEQVPRPPSEYCHHNVTIGASFLAGFEADVAVREGYSDNVLWGSDYPHMEGTYQYPRAADEVPMTRLALRNTFAGIPEDRVVAMAGANAAQVYGLDRDALGDVARRIGAPTLDELSRPLDRVPEHAGMLAFRTFGPWA